MSTVNLKLTASEKLSSTLSVSGSFSVPQKLRNIFSWLRKHKVPNLCMIMRLAKYDFKSIHSKGKIACIQLHDYVLTVEAKYLQVNF